MSLGLDFEFKLGGLSGDADSHFRRLASRTKPRRTERRIARKRSFFFADGKAWTTSSRDLRVIKKTSTKLSALAIHVCLSASMLRITSSPHTAPLHACMVAHACTWDESRVRGGGEAYARTRGQEKAE